MNKTLAASLMAAAAVSVAVPAAAQNHGPARGGPAAHAPAWQSIAQRKATLDRRIDRANATLPYMQSLESEKLPGKSVPERVRRKTDTPFTIPGERFDDGFSPLTVADYLYLRIRNQIDW
ncbi:MAG: hypothetical protein ACK4Y4_08150, partial [Brevundimonas sp.]